METMQSNISYNKAIVSSFTYPRREFIRMIRQLKRPALIKSKEFHFVKCDLFVGPNQVTMCLPGSQIYLDCETIGKCRASFYLRDVYEAIKYNKNEMINIAISLTTIHVNNITLTSSTIELSAYSKKSDLEIPLGFLKKQDDFFEQKNEHLVKDYISLHNKKSFYRLDIEMDVVKAMVFLKNYGVTQSEIQQLVYKHLKKSR